MTFQTRIERVTSFLILGILWLAVANAQSPAPTPSTEPQSNLYAVEITIGPKWDSTKKPNEQAFFREHSANLKRLRDQGSLLLGARYSDKGLLVLQATSETEAHAMMQEDPSIQAGVFSYELHGLNVFYGGEVQGRKRK